MRIMESNRIAVGCDVEIHTPYEFAFREIERRAEKDIREQMRAHPIANWIANVKGLAEVSAAQIVSHIDIEKCGTISALWRYAGYGVVDGQRERPVKGQRLPYNRTLKTAVYRAIALQIRLGGPYARVYRDAKHTYLTTRGPDSGVSADRRWTLAHCELAARRKAAKVFLSHMWQVWRAAVGLPVSEPFIARSAGHDVIDPWEFLKSSEPEPVRNPN